MHGVLADGTPFDVTAKPGQRVPLLPSDKVRGGSVRYHADGLSVCVENGYAGITGDLAGHFTLADEDGGLLFDGDLVIWAYTRTHPVWLRSPQLLPAPDLSLFPTYGPGSGKESMAAVYAAADNGPMGHSMFTTAMDMVGERSDLGPVLPEWDADYLVNPTDANATVVRGMADASSNWAYHMIDPATDEMIDLRGNPWITSLGVFLGKPPAGAWKGQPNNPMQPVTTANPHKVGDSGSHAVALCALAAAIYGTDYDREELAHWANYVGALCQNPTYRKPSGVISMKTGQVRDKGRRMYVLVCAAKLSHATDYFDAWARDSGVSIYADLIDNQAGIAIDQTGEIYPDPKGGWAPWMQHILVHSIGFAIHAGYTDFQRALDYFAGPIFDSILTAPHELATIYTVAGQEADGSQVADWTRALARTGDLKATVAAALAHPEGSLELTDALGRGDRAGDFTGYPSSPSGYAAMLQPALAVLVQYATDKARAAAAWEKFQQWQRIDYTQNPKYNIVPREVA